MISNLTKSILEMIPGLFSNPPRIKNAATDELHLRTAYVESGTPTTYVVPGDWPEDPKHWFTADVPRWPVRDGNDVEFLVGGEATYEAMVEAMETAHSSEHFIVLLGWTLHVADFQLSTSGRRCLQAKDTLINVLRDRVSRGVSLRVLLYDNWVADGIAPPVRKSVREIMDLERPRPADLAGAKVLAILDKGYRDVRGSHHQKILLINGSKGLMGFVGGIDFHPDRVYPVSMGAPLHDVHARIVGEAAMDLLSLAVDRWNNSIPREFDPDNSVVVGSGREQFRSAIYARGVDMYDMRKMLDLARNSSVAEPRRVVKINQTIGNPATAKWQTSGLWAAVQRVLQEAREFVYIEDQYLWSVDLMEALAKAAAKPSLKHVTILIPPDHQVQYVNARHAALKKLKEICGPGWRKIGIYTRTGSVGSYIHSKTMVIDDRVAITGSANANNRGYFNDSEVHCVVADPVWTLPTSAWSGRWWQLDLTLAHKLRIELWQNHLTLGAEELIDGVASVVHWRTPQSGSHIVEYKINNKSWHDHVYDDYYFIEDMVDPRP